MKTRITPFLWFNDQAEEAVRFYTSIFENSRIGSVTRYGEDGPGPKGAVMSATFKLDYSAPVVDLQPTRWFLWPCNGRKMPVKVGSLDMAMTASISPVSIDSPRITRLWSSWSTSRGRADAPDR